MLFKTIETETMLTLRKFDHISIPGLIL